MIEGKNDGYSLLKDIWAALTGGKQSDGSPMPPALFASPDSSVSQGFLFTMPVGDFAGGCEIGVSAGGGTGVRPSSSSGIRLFVPASGSIEISFDAALFGDTGSETGHTVTLSPGIYDFPLSSADSIYMSQCTGAVLGIWVK